MDIPVSASATSSSQEGEGGRRDPFDDTSGQVRHEAKRQRTGSATFEEKEETEGLDHGARLELLENVPDDVKQTFYNLVGYTHSMVWTTEDEDPQKVILERYKQEVTKEPRLAYVITPRTENTLLAMLIDFSSERNVRKETLDTIKYLIAANPLALVLRHSANVPRTATTLNKIVESEELCHGLLGFIVEKHPWTIERNHQCAVCPIFLSMLLCTEGSNKTTDRSLPASAIQTYYKKNPGALGRSSYLGGGLGSLGPRALLPLHLIAPAVHSLGMDFVKWAIEQHPRAIWTDMPLERGTALTACVRTLLDSSYLDRRDTDRLSAREESALSEICRWMLVKWPLILLEQVSDSYSIVDQVPLHEILEYCSEPAVRSLAICILRLKVSLGQQCNHPSGHTHRFILYLESTIRQEADLQKEGYHMRRISAILGKAKGKGWQLRHESYSKWAEGRLVKLAEPIRQLRRQIATDAQKLAPRPYREREEDRDT